MLKIVHLASAGLLAISHCTFLFRAFYLTTTGLKPQGIDRIARALSHILLPVAVVTGIINFIGARGAMHFFPHPLAGFLPLAAVPLVNAGRIILKKRKELPWLLPVINLILILSALITGFL